MGFRFDDDRMVAHRTGSEMTDMPISDIDDASNPQYYGYVNQEGGWVIMKYDTSAKTIRYAKGFGNYASNWTNRATSGVVYGYIGA